MDANQSGDLYQKDTVGPEWLEDLKDTNWLDKVHANWLSNNEDWRMRGLWAYI